MKTIEVDKSKVTLHLWDTAGLERFSALTSSFYSRAAGIMLCFAVNDRTSFERVIHWMVQVQQFAKKDVCKILVATKCDIEDRCVSQKEGEMLAERYGIKYIETSAKENKNVEEAFRTLTKIIKDNGKLNKQTESISRTRLSSKAKIEKENGCCGS